ncbi:MAG: DegV family protein [Clostridia bacterium]|nr:DegV family protein [Clostridia bacterium]
MKKIIISVDSAADLPKNFAGENGIEIMPMYVIADRKELRDGIDINGKGVFEYVEKTGKIPKTSAVSPNEYAEYFSAFTSDGADVIHLSFCSLLSSTHRNAVIAANQFNGVHVIDTKNLGGGIGLLALKSCAMRDKGLSADDICAETEKLIPKTRVSYLLESVEFLRLGGRCSAVSALGANLFSIRPCAGMVDGRIEILEKFKGKSDAARVKYTESILEKFPSADKSAAFIYHSGISKTELDFAAEKLRNAGFEKIITAENGSIISIHSAPRAFGIHIIA